MSSGYNGSTENIQGDLEASTTDTSRSSSLWRQLDSPACASSTSPDDWVPTGRERAVVPAQLATLCQACPAREECLAWAILSDSRGYWAGTTTANRRTMVQARNTSVSYADELQGSMRSLTPEPLHAAGMGSAQWYRKRGCHCDECRAAAADRRARQRGRSPGGGLVHAGG